MWWIYFNILILSFESIKWIEILLTKGKNNSTILITVGSIFILSILIYIAYKGINIEKKTIEYLIQKGNYTIKETKITDFKYYNISWDEYSTSESWYYIVSTDWEKTYESKNLENAICLWCKEIDIKYFENLWIDFEKNNKNNTKEEIYSKIRFYENEKKMLDSLKKGK